MDASVRGIGRRIPELALRVFADIVAERESTAGIDRLFIVLAGRRERMRGSKLARAHAWLHALNDDPATPALQVFGQLIARYLVDAPGALVLPGSPRARDQERLRAALAADGLRFEPPDRIVVDWATAAPDAWQVPLDGEVARIEPRDPAKR